MQSRYDDCEPLSNDFAAFCNEADYTVADVQSDPDLRRRLEQRFEQSHSEPTYANQLWHARKLLQEKGIAAVDNPSGMIGRTCKCFNCFCCAAAQVVREYRAEAETV